MSRVPPLEITAEQRTELERRLRAHTTTQRALRRARIILLAADGVPNRQIARQVGIHEKGVATWRQRFVAAGLAGLEDARRPGRPRVYGHDARLAIVATVTTQQPAVDSQWTHQLIAERLHQDGVGISSSQVGRILADLDLKPTWSVAGSTAPTPPTSSNGLPRCAGCTWTGRTTRWCSASTRRPRSPPGRASTPPGDAPRAWLSGASLRTSATAPRA